MEDTGALVRALGSAMFWFGLAVGVPTGIAFQAARAARRSYLATKKLVPAMRKTKWTNIFKFARLAVVVAVLVAASMAWMAGLDAGDDSTVPASVPSVPAESPR